MKSRLNCLSTIAIVLICSLRVLGAGTLDIEPLWSVGIITDTQTSDRASIVSLMSRVKAESPEMVVHIGDTCFDSSDQFVMRNLADMLEGNTNGTEFHLAPGNHDMSGGELKEYLRRVATRGIFRFDTGPTFGAHSYMHSRVAAYVPDPSIPVWNPEIVNHSGWQPDSKARFAGFGNNSDSCRYVFKRGSIRFIICDWSYSNEQRQWLRDIITKPDDSSVSIVFHHAHHISKLNRYFEGLEGRHNVKLVLSGHDHRYHHAKKGGITYITSAGIARSERGCDAMILRVHRNYLRLDRYTTSHEASGLTVSRPSAIWMCNGNFTPYYRPELPRRKPALAKKSPAANLAPGLFYNSAK